MKGTEITLRLAVSAAAIAEQRRRYAAYLKTSGKNPLPPHGGGDRYSGAKLSTADKKRVEALLSEGLGASKIAERTGVSKTSVQRIRNKLVKRLKRSGQTLAGCDSNGRRHIRFSSKFLRRKSTMTSRP